MLVVAVVVLAGVVAVASGRGGEMAIPEPDYPPIDLGPVSAADVALLRPPSAAWGYNMRVTDEALEVIARAVTERDVQIAALQQEVTDLRDQLHGGAWPERAGADPAAPGVPGELDDPLAPAGQAGAGAVPEPGDYTGHDDDREPAEADAGGDAETPEQPWPGPAVPHAPGADSGPSAPPVAITRPQPLYRHPGDAGDDQGGHDQAGIASDQPAARETGAPAPWGPAQHPDDPAAPGVADDHGWGTDPGSTNPDARPLDWAATAPPAQDTQPGYGEPPAPGEPAAGDPGEPGATGHAPARGSAPATNPQPIVEPVRPTSPQPIVEPVRPTNPQPIVPSQPTAPSGQSQPTAPSGQSQPTAPSRPPQPSHLSEQAQAPEQSQPPQGAGQGRQAEPEPTDWTGGSQPSPAPSVWDMASRQVDEDQAYRPPPPADDHAEFTWDEDPHQTLVWGPANARAKAARATEETLPNAEHRDDERG